MNAKTTQTKTPKNLALPALAGLGGSNSRVAIYLANRPPFDDYPQLDVLRPMLGGEVDHIVRNTSNHWRKVFNVYAKFVFEWSALAGSPLIEECNGFKRWQDYRDRRLLQSGSVAALLFTAPNTDVVHPGGRSATEPKPSECINSECINIVAGKTYAQQLGLAAELVWLDAHFAVHVAKRIIVCPYLDYRQLSNERISRLIAYIQALLDHDWDTAAVQAMSIERDGVELEENHQAAERADPGAAQNKPAGRHASEKPL